MSLNDPLANALSHITNVEKLGKNEVVLHDNNKIIKKVLTLMKEHKYLGEFHEDSDKKIIVNLIGKINKTNVVKPRFSCSMDEYDEFEKWLLPAKDFGILIVSTSKGMMTHVEAKKHNLGGRLIAYCY